jgi:2',3'-cyclic-nucleotide 2'-phosphodiesterase (5'-nucleotidase family)
MACTLRIYQVNDVYELDNWPHFCSARNDPSNAVAAHKTIGVLPGDFVAPSLLSSLDNGHGMIDCMNVSGIDYVCIGNHESDISLDALHARIAQSSFKWINSNMQGMFLKPGLSTPEYDIIEVQGSDGHTRRVAIIGMCTEDKSILRDGAFGNCAIGNIESTSHKLAARLREEEGVDVVIPMTHQLMHLDRALAQKGLFPVILGGHDHLPYLETYDPALLSWTNHLDAGACASERKVVCGEGCTVVKTGIDGKNIARIDITFTSTSSASPSVSVTLVTLTLALTFTLTLTFTLILTQTPTNPNPNPNFYPNPNPNLNLNPNTS